MMFTVCVTLMGKVDEAFPLVTLRAGHVDAVVSGDQTVDLKLLMIFTRRNVYAQFKHSFASYICECIIKTVFQNTFTCRNTSPFGFAYTIRTAGCTRAILDVTVVTGDVHSLQYFDGKGGRDLPVGHIQSRTCRRCRECRSNSRFTTSDDIHNTQRLC